VSAHTVVEGVILAGLVLSCWLGVLGMLRMREPKQALHYLSLASSFGVALLTAAVFMATGNSSASWKTPFIGAVLMSANSVVTHTTARAFRTRELGHWQPRPGDNVEWVRRERGDA